MNLEETSRVLAWAAAFDRRKVGAMDVQAWHAAIGDLPVDDCLAGVTRWYRDRSDWLMPSHLRESVRLVRADRQRDDRVRRAEERGQQPALEVTSTRMADLPGDVREMLRSAGRGHYAVPYGPPESCEHPEPSREQYEAGWRCVACGTHVVTDDKLWAERYPGGVPAESAVAHLAVERMTGVPQ